MPTVQTTVFSRGGSPGKEAVLFCSGPARKEVPLWRRYTLSKPILPCSHPRLRLCASEAGGNPGYYQKHSLFIFYFFSPFIYPGEKNFRIGRTKLRLDTSY